MATTSFKYWVWLSFLVLVPGGMLCLGRTNAQDTAPLVPGVRTWSSAADPNAKLEAILSSATADYGIFERVGSSNSNKGIQIAWDKVVDAKLIAELAWLDRDDSRLYERVIEHLDQFEDAPITKAEIFLTMHRDATQNPFATGGKSMSPYAGLWTSVALAAGKNDQQKAIGILNQALEDIKRQQEVSSERHRMSLTSAYNNLGILYIKNHQGDTAAAQFVKAIQVNQNVPVVVRHNAMQLAEMTNNKFAKLSLSDAHRRLLAKAIGTSTVEGKQVKLPVGWLFALDFDVPPDDRSSAKYEGIDAPLGGMEIIAVGTGVVVSPGTVLTSRSVVLPENRTDSTIVTICAPMANGGWSSLIVNRIMADATKTVATTGRNTTTHSSLTGRSHKVQTNYDFVHPKKGEASGELAALHAPGLKTPHALVSTANSPLGKKIELLGYFRAEDMLQRGLVVAKGGAGSIAKSSSQAITCRVEGGNIGGPVLNDQGVVCGIAAHGDGNGGGSMIHIEGVRKWLSENDGNVQVTELDPKLSLEQLQARARTATLPVIVWGFPAEQSLAHQINASDRARGALYIRDDWCLQCRGTGFFDCPDCVKGGQSKPRQTLQGVGFDGTPVFRTVYDRVPCTSCRQSGSFTCQSCVNGKLNVK